MFGSKPAMPRGGILSYEQAVTKYEGIVPIRGRAVDTRPLANRRSDNLTIRKLGDNSVAIQLYRTNIITYHPDGTIELEPYASNLTTEAVSTILKGGRVRAQYTHSAGPVLWVRGKGYATKGVFTLDADLDLISGSVPFTYYSVDKAKAAAVRKLSGLNQFTLWLNTMVRLGQDPRGGSRDRSASWWAVIGMLPDPKYYPELAAGLTRGGSVVDALTPLRRAVYKHHDCIVETTVPFVESHAQLQNIAASARHWG